MVKATFHDCCRGELTTQVLDAEYDAGNTVGTTTKFEQYYKDRSYLQGLKARLPVLDAFLDEILHGKLLQTPRWQRNPMRMAYHRLRLAGVSRKGLIQLTDPPLRAIRYELACQSSAALWTAPPFIAICMPVRKCCDWVPSHDTETGERLASKAMLTAPLL